MEPTLLHLLWLSTESTHPKSPLCFAQSTWGQRDHLAATCPGAGHSTGGSGGEEPAWRQIRLLDARFDTGESHNLFVLCKGQYMTMWEVAWGLQRTSSADKPALRTADCWSKTGGGAEGMLRRERRDILRTRDSETLMCVWLLVSALLSPAALLIPGFGDVKSLLHLFPCQLCSRYLQPWAHFRWKVSDKCSPHVTLKHCTSPLVWFQWSLRNTCMVCQHTERCYIGVVWPKIKGVYSVQHNAVARL